MQIEIGFNFYRQNQPGEALQPKTHLAHNKSFIKDRLQQAFSSKTTRNIYSSKNQLRVTPCTLAPEYLHNYHLGHQKQYSMIE